MSAPVTPFSKAVGRQWLWKNPAMSRMTRAILELALERNGGEFSANDLPESLDHGGRGTCGVIFHSLANDGVFRAIGFHQYGEWFPKTTKNAGGNKIGIYALASEPLARELLSRHSQCELPPEPVPVKAEQQQFLPADDADLPAIKTGVSICENEPSICGGKS